MMKLLIADDDLTSRVLLENLARKWGWEPVVVEEGEAAWEVLQQDNSPRLLLIDWEMPRLSGLALCQRIRKQLNTDPAYIILLTSRDKTIDIVTGLHVGANDYITKPFNNVELQARIQVGKRMLGLQQELNQAKELLAFKACHDELTGLLNRGAIMESLDKELARSYRQKLPLCVAMCDIDLFKQINDNYGHIAGDHVIREVAQRIRAELRPYDLAGRYGGEEFLLVFNSSLQDAQKSLERIRLSISNTPFNYEKEVLKVTISCGVTVYDSFVNEGNKQVLIGAADKALYEAKENGRNKVVLA